MQTFSIRKKLLLITLASSAVALLFVSAAFLMCSYFSLREQMEDDLSALAQVIGNQSAAGMMEGDNVTTAAILRTLAAQKKGVVAIGIYANNSLFVSYVAPKQKTFSFPQNTNAAGWEFANGYLRGFQPVHFNDANIGMVYICADLKALHAALWRYTAVALLFTAVSLMVAYLLASRLQRIISRPISHLAQTAEIISAGKNYSVRAVKESDDELGQLIDGFNEMLAQIEARGVALQRVNDGLEKRVAERTEDLQQQCDRISLLNQITFAVVARQDAESIIMVVLQQLEHNLPLDFSSAYWFDEKSGLLKIMACGPKAWGLLDQFEPQSEFKLSDLGLEKCAQGETVYLPDLSDCDLPRAREIFKSGFFSCLALPLFLDAKMFGLTIFLRRAADAFKEAERVFIHNVGTHIALAIRQAQLYQDLQKAYNDLHDTQQAAMQQERLKALGQMASGIAHDINNALSPVVGFSDLIVRTEPALSENGKKYLRYIKTAGEDITHIVASLREFYRLRDGNEAVHPLNLNRLAQQVIDMTRPRWRDLSHRRNIVVEMRQEFAKNLPQCAGVETEVREAITNLVMNAVDALPSGGIITVRTRAVANEVILEISDTGIGMDEVTRKCCLEPFFSTKGRRGTGLGLAMVYGIMERHQGRIEIDSAPNQGTTMRLFFSAQKGELPIVVATPDEVPPGPFRILCIDDEPAIRDLIFELLNHDGHCVQVADSGKNGLAAFRDARTQGNPFDVVITDLGMPYMDGREVASRLKAETPEIPIVMLTGWGAYMKDDRVEAVDGILSKPPQIGEIRSMLRQVVNGNHSKS